MHSIKRKSTLDRKASQLCRYITTARDPKDDRCQVLDEDCIYYGLKHHCYQRESIHAMDKKPLDYRGDKFRKGGRVV